MGGKISVKDNQGGGSIFYFSLPYSLPENIENEAITLDDSVISNEKILIVDDFCLTGEFYEKLISFLVGEGFKRDKIKIFCAVITQVTKSADRAPEYYHLVTDDDNFYFPWGKANTG